ncbi:MAG: stage V sporulation protein AB [Eubacteriales bacterium]|nr:stage V sporulation protein AB [Eubacteriales bacterium]
MWRQLFLGFLGLCAGGMIAAGLAGLIIGLAIVPRYAGVTHTGDKILVYEDTTLLGILFGNLFYLFHLQIPAGNIGLAVFGVSSGIFLGAWILALAEMADVFPILSRRIRLTWGIPAVIVTLSAAKTIGSLVFFFQGWQ